MGSSLHCTSGSAISPVTRHGFPRCRTPGSWWWGTLALLLVFSRPAFAQDFDVVDFERKVDATLRSACHGYLIDMLPEGLADLRSWLYESSPACTEVARLERDEPLRKVFERLPMSRKDVARIYDRDAWTLPNGAGAVAANIDIACEMEFMCLKIRRRLARTADPVSQVGYDLVAQSCADEPSPYFCIENWFSHWPRSLPTLDAPTAAVSAPTSDSTTTSDSHAGQGPESPPGWLTGASDSRSGSSADARPNGDGTMPSGDRALLILIDASGSMDTDQKMAQAKAGAIAGIDRTGRGIWVLVASFSGDCDVPVQTHQSWTQDRDAAKRAVQSISPGGGTPLAPALTWANQTIRAFAGEARRGGVILLADGQNDCGDVGAALGQMQHGIVFHNEAIGVGLETSAVADMRQIATRTGGNFHNVRDASGIRQAFDDSFTNLYQFFTSWDDIIRR